MTVVVTGGTGLLGYGVLERLAGTDDVVALHRPGSEPPVIPGVEWVAQDLTATLGGRLPGRVDAVLHVAQSRHHRTFPDGAVDVFDVNVGSTVRLLDYCRRAGGSAFVQASSGAVYRPGPVALSERDDPDPPSFYGHSKLAAEQAALAFGGLFAVSVLRLFFVYGARQDGGAFLPGVRARILDGVPVRLSGPDGLRCNPIHVDDAAAAVQAAWTTGFSGVVNVAGPETVSLRSIAETLGGLLDREPRFEHAGAAGDLVADIARMSECLGAPTTGVRAGLERELGPART